MRIAVLGGAGATGSAAVRNLVEDKHVSEVLVGDANEEKLEKFASKLRSSKVSTKVVDVRKIDETADFIRGCDVVINAVQYYFNLDVMMSALKAGVHYVDHGGLYHVTLKQLELDDQFCSKGLTALVGMGAQPGLTNLCASHAASLLDEMKAVYIRDGYRDLTPNGPFFTWSPSTLFDEMMLDAVVLRGGKTVSVPAFSLSEEVDFPEPVGRLKTYVTLHSELATFPRSFKGKNLSECDWMEGSPELELIKKLADIGFASLDEIDYEGCRVSPRRLFLKLVEMKDLMGFREGVVPDDWEYTYVYVVGRKMSRDVKLVYRILFPPHQCWMMSCSQTGVGIPSSTAAVMIAENQITARGVVPPETALEPASFFEKMAQHGIEIMQTEESIR
ncbi:MAG: saccharopine dehydrogenase NADP-binding domain-containing protein [Candidatus Caldarchaeum sp.]